MSLFQPLRISLDFGFLNGQKLRYFIVLHSYLKDLGAFLFSLLDTLAQNGFRTDLKDF